MLLASAPCAARFTSVVHLFVSLGWFSLAVSMTRTSVLVFDCTENTSISCSLPGISLLLLASERVKFKGMQFANTVIFYIVWSMQMRQLRQDLVAQSVK